MKTKKNVVMKRKFREVEKNESFVEKVGDEHRQHVERAIEAVVAVENLVEVLTTVEPVPKGAVAAMKVKEAEEAIAVDEGVVEGVTVNEDDHRIKKVVEVVVAIPTMKKLQLQWWLIELNTAIPVMALSRPNHPIPCI